MLLGTLALTTSSVFAGAAFYIHFVEQPARLALDDRALLAEWKPSFRRAVVMQAPLAFLGFVLGAAAWWTSGSALFLVGALLMLAIAPWTAFGIMPTNRALLATEPAAAGPATRALVVKWNGLHAVRTTLSILAAVCFLTALG